MLSWRGPCRCEGGWPAYPGTCSSTVVSVSSADEFAPWAWTMCTYQSLTSSLGRAIAWRRSTRLTPSSYSIGATQHDTCPRVGREDGSGSHNERMVAQRHAVSPPRTSHLTLPCSRASHALGRCRLAITGDVEARARRDGVRPLIQSGCPGMRDDRVHVRVPAALRACRPLRVLRGAEDVRFPVRRLPAQPRATGCATRGWTRPQTRTSTSSAASPPCAHVAAHAR